MAVSRRQFIQERPPTAQDFGEAPQRASLAVEPVSGWWSRNGKWGNRFQGTLPGPGELIGILNLDAVPGPPRAVGVQLFRSDRNAAAFGDSNSEVNARITYGAGGVTNTFEVDFLQGQAFTLICNSVRIDAVAYNPTGDVYEATQQVVLGATIGLGSIGCTCPTLTYPTGFLAPGAMFQRAFPDFAKRVSLVSEDYTADSASLITRIRSTLGTVLFSGTWTQMQAHLSAGIPIPGNAATIEIQNNSLAQKFLSFVFHLGL